jgi:hypothetical protein
MSSDFPDIDFVDYHRNELPNLLAAGRGALAFQGVARLGSLAFRIGEPEPGAFTYRQRDGDIEIVAGDAHADLVFEISASDWQGLVHDLDSAPGLLYGRRVTCVRGNAIDLVAWELGLRAMYSGRPVFDPFECDLRDRRGAPLDPKCSFQLTSNRDEMAHFLRTAGYLVVREVFSEAEVAAFLAEAEALRGEAVKGDRLSWWGKNASREEVLCRVTRAGAKPALRSLPSDTRLLSLVDLADQRLVHRGRGDSDEGVTLVYKNPDMAEGLSDLPWHRDCGMGGHAAMCPVLIASVFLTPSNEKTGDLKVLPGSWQGSCAPIDAGHPKAPAGVHLIAQPGDVSLHYGETMHAAPPPDSGQDDYRISALTGYARPGAGNHRGEKNYNEVLHQRDDGQIEHLADATARRDPAR